MTHYVALLRGINVGGQKKFPKAEQLALLESLAVANPHVYLHTGNWVFASEKEASVLEKEISATLKKQYGWEIPIVVKSATELQAIFEGCPFPKQEKEQSYFALLQAVPSEAHKEKVKAYDFPGEAAHVTDACVYFCSATGYGKAKMNNNWFETKLKVAATTRNYKTMNRLFRMLFDS